MWERHNLEESDWCIQPIKLLHHSEPLSSLFPLAVAPVHPHAGGPGESLTSGLPLTAPPPPFWGRLCGVRLSRPQLQDDCRQDEEESVPAQGNSEASPHHHPRQTPAWWEDLYLQLLHRLRKQKTKQAKSGHRKRQGRRFQHQIYANYDQKVLRLHLQESRNSTPSLQGCLYMHLCVFPWARANLRFLSNHPFICDLCREQASASVPIWLFMLRTINGSWAATQRRVRHVRSIVQKRSMLLHFLLDIFTVLCTVTLSNGSDCQWEALM